IWVTRTSPISLVVRTWVPPQGCRSYPTISMSRTRPVPTGGLTDMVLTRPGWAASSASVIQRAHLGAAGAHLGELPGDLVLVEAGFGNDEIEPPLVVADGAARYRIGEHG